MTITTLYKYGFILVHPMREYFANGKTVLREELPRLLNTAYIVDITIGQTQCLITLVNGSTIVTKTDALMNQLRQL